MGDTLKKLLFLLITFLLLTACGLANEPDRRTGSLEEPTPIPTAVSAARPTYEVTRGQVVYSIDFTGRVASTVEQTMSFPLDGVVTEVYVDTGDIVETGTPIAALDTASLNSQMVLAQSALEVAQGELAVSEQLVAQARQSAELARDIAQLDLDFAILQAGSNPTPAQQYQIDRLTLLLAQAQLEVDALNDTVDPELKAAVDSAALRVTEIENLIEQAVLVAPFDGEITAVSVSPGRAVSAGTAIGVIAEPQQIEVTANLRDALMQELVEGMSVIIQPAGAPGEGLPGTIRRLPYPFGSGGEADLNESDQSVRIEFEDMSAGLAQYQPGDRVSMNVVVTEHDDVLWLPPAAIRDFNGRKFVVTQVNGVEQRVDVTLGIEGNGRVEILTGLEEGTTIVGQ